MIRAILRVGVAVFTCTVPVHIGHAQPAASSAGRGTAAGPNDAPTLLDRRLRVTLAGVRLEDALTWFHESTSLTLEPLWLDDRHADGLDRDRIISARADDEPAVALLERILDAAGPNSGGDATWQLTSSGAVQVGPRGRLNAYRRVEVYAIDDITRAVPRYTDSPSIDLQQALESARGGGGGSPIRIDPGSDEPGWSRSERVVDADELISLIRELVEPAQWSENGGTGGTIRLFRGALVVSAPDYIHRAIAGRVRAGGSR